MTYLRNGASYVDIPAEDHIGILVILATLWRGKIIILSCMIATLAIAAVYVTLIATPMYRATTQMSLLAQTESVVDIDSVLSGVSADRASINTELEVIRSRALLGRLVDGLDLTADPEFNPLLAPPGILARVGAPLRRLIQADPTAPTAEAVRNGAIDRLLLAIEVDAQDNSFVFRINATTRDPIKSALLANTLATYYRDDQIALKVTATENAALWLAERVAELQGEIEAAETGINGLRTRNTLISAEAIAALNTQSVAVTEALQDAELALRRATDQVAAVEGAANEGFTIRATASGDPQLLGLITDAEAGDAGAILRFDRRFEQMLLQQRGEVARAEAAVQDLELQSETITRRFEAQSQALIEIEQSERETQAARILYETFLTRLKETTVQVGVHQADSRILSEAVAGVQVSPRKAVLLALSLVLGAIVGALLVLVRDALQNTFRTASDIERHTGRTVLGQIPKIPTSGRFSTIAYLAQKPGSAAAEAVRNLRTSILMSNVDRDCQVILSTSSIPGEGKTTLAIALAQNLAGLDKSVILIEGDIRRRKFTEYFPQAANHPGLLSVISGQATVPEAVWSDPDTRVDLLMGEKSSVNAADVLSSESFRSLIQSLRADYDYIIIDAPPVLVVPDARIIGTVVDAILYVVQWDRTTRTQLDDGLKQLRDVNLPVTGLVLSQIDADGMRRFGLGENYASSRLAADYYDN